MKSKIALTFLAILTVGGCASDLGDEVMPREIKTLGVDPIKRQMSFSEVFMRMSYHYPNASIYVVDKKFEIPSEEIVKEAYDGFVKSMEAAGTATWVKDKWDCDKFAIAFKSYFSAQNALSDKLYSYSVGVLFYFEGGDEKLPHAINNAIIIKDSVVELIEIDPQPGNVIKRLTKKERKSAWFILM